MSLLHPPQGFPPHLAFFWPLIWCQILLLRAAVRAAYGEGVQYHWSVSPNGRVFLTSIDWVPGQKAEREWLKPSGHFNGRLAAACDGCAVTPAYSGLSAHPFEGEMRTAARAFSPGQATDLPLPET